jgi:flagellar biosynthesis protein FliP
MSPIAPPQRRFPGSHRAWAVALVALAGAALAALWPQPGWAQSLSLDLGEGGAQSTSRIIQMLGLLTVLSLAPSILVMVTAFTRIVVVLGFLRSAMGIQSAPPSQVVISLALFLTAFVMAPTFERAYNEGVRPLMADEISEAVALDRIVTPFHRFMSANVRPRDVRLFMDLSRTPAVERPEQIPLRVLVPAFMISELRRAFEIGFLLFLPFLIIDMVVASVLMAMGMMMLPPVSVSLPFKLVFFVLVDGWFLISGALVQSFNSG